MGSTLLISGNDPEKEYSHSQELPTILNQEFSEILHNNLSL